MHRAIIGLAAVAGWLAASPARAEPERAQWVDRRLTPPGGTWDLDFGLGIGHVPDFVAEHTGSPNALGANAEMGVGLTDHVELGARTGLRLGDDFERSIRADQYGRLFDRQTFGTGADALANPEARIRGAVVRGLVAEVALEGRLVLPLERGTNAGAMFGVPLAFHVGERVRLDTGAYVPIVFDHDVSTWMSIPFDVWIQASERVWLGPMTGVVFPRHGNGFMSLGFGVGYSISDAVDFKAMALFPDVSDDTRFFGLGAGVQVRIE